MQKITPEELLKRVGEISASTIASVTINTPVKMLKKHRETGEPCPFKNVTKRSVMTGMFGTNYELGVNRRRAKEASEANFEAAPHQWADHVEEKASIVTNKAGDKWYANLRVLRVLSVQYFEDGIPIDEDELDLEGYGPKKSTSSRQGTKDMVIWRTVSLAPVSSFESIRANGQEIVIY